MSEKDQETTITNTTTHPDFWDCECEENYIRAKSITNICSICRTNAREQPDSRIVELERGNSFANKYHFNVYQKQRGELKMEEKLYLVKYSYRGTEDKSYSRSIIVKLSSEKGILSAMAKELGGKLHIINITVHDLANMNKGDVWFT